MLKADLLTVEGEKAGTINLPAEIFAAKINPPLVAQAVRVYLANQRRARAKTKTRGDVAGSGKKIYAQKGTGRARHGDRYAPIFVGGGIAHGPSGRENYHLEMPKKMRQLALFSALTSRFKAGEIIFVKDLVPAEAKTKAVAVILKALKLDTSLENGQKVLIILATSREKISQAGKNIANVRFIGVSGLNTYVALSGVKIVLAEEAIGKLKEQFLKEK